EKSLDLVDVVFGHRSSELILCHDADRVGKRLGRPVMEVGSRMLHVPEAGNPEHGAVVRYAGSLRRAGCLRTFRRSLRLAEYAEYLQHVAADIDALMAG